MFHSSRVILRGVTLVLVAAHVALAAEGTSLPKSADADSHKMAAGASLKIYVAASTKEVVERIAEQYRAETGTAVEVSPGASSKLSKQISEGAPADLFLSADVANVNYLAEKKLVAERRDLLGNSLVVVVPADSKIKIESLADLAGGDVKQVALALEKVPAGEYARQALRNAGVWEQVEKKIVGGEDVRATLAFVENGVPAGIVYKTDPIGDSRVRLALRIDPKLHDEIVYPLAVLARSPSNPNTAKFFDYLTSEKSKEFFHGAGFTTR